MTDYNDNWLLEHLGPCATLDDANAAHAVLVENWAQIVIFHRAVTVFE